MKVFITGGSGFVGGHVIEALAPHHEVLALARSEASAAKVEALGATAVRGALEDITAEMLAGVDAVVHGAAYVEDWGPEEVYWTTNVEGTQRLLDAAQQAGTARFIQVSTNAAVHDRQGQLGIDESAPYPAHRGFPYGATKAEAERRVLAANRQGFTTIAVRPCFVWGPRDNSVLPTLRRISEAGTFAWIDGGQAQVSTTHVHNLVAAIERALTHGNGGQAYFVADDDDLSMRDFVSGLAQADGFRLKGPTLPSWLLRGVAGVAEGAWRLVGAQNPPPVTRMSVDLMACDMTVRSDRARDELGWTPVVSRSEGLQGMARA